MAPSSSSLPWIAHIEAYMADSHQVTGRDALAELLMKGEITMQDVVREMDDFLTTTDHVVRTRGVLLVGELLSQLSKKPLEYTAIHSFATFFSSRLSDWHALRGALVGTLALLRREKTVGVISHEDGKCFLKSALENLDVQALSQYDRMLCFEMFESMLSHHADAVKSFGENFVTGMTAAIDAEKDPRCLLLAFRIVEMMSQIFPDPDGPVGILSEDLFGIISCYFPISFSPPPNDTRGITKEDLSTALMHTFSSSVFFAPFCIPLLLEKLSSSLHSAKLESLKYLSFCSCHYGAEVMQEYSEDIWASLKMELLPASALNQESPVISGQQIDEDVVNLACMCLTNCVKITQENVDIRMQMQAGKLLEVVLNDDFFEDLCMSLPSLEIMDSIELLDEKSSNGFTVLCPIIDGPDVKAMGNILSAVIRSSVSASFLVLEKFFGRLGKICTVPSSALGSANILTILKENRFESHLYFKGSLSLSLLSIIIQMLQAAQKLSEHCVLGTKSFGGVSKCLHMDKWILPIQLYGKQLIVFFVLSVMIGLRQDNVGISTNRLLQLGVSGLQTLASFPPTASPITQDELQFIIKYLLKVVEQNFCNKPLWDQAVFALATVLSQEMKFSDDSGVTYLTIPHMLQLLQENKTMLPTRLNLQALAMICSPKPSVLSKVIPKLQKIVSEEVSKLSEANKEYSDFAKLRSVLEGLSHEILPRYDDKQMQDQILLQLALECWSLVDKLDSLSIRRIDIFKEFGEVLRISIAKCEEESQALFLLKSSESISQGLSRYLEIRIYTDTWLIALFAFVLVSLRPSVYIPQNGLVMRMLLRLAVECSNETISGVATEALGSMMNKWPAAGNQVDTIRKCNEISLDSAINFYLEGKWFLLNEGECKLAAKNNQSDLGYEQSELVSTKLRCIKTISYIGKGLVMRGHNRISDVAVLLLKLIHYSTSSMRDSRDEVASLLHAVRPNPGEEHVISLAASKGLGIIIGESDCYLNKLHHAVIKPIYKQRFFLSMLPLLLAAQKEADPVGRVMIYRAFGHLIAGAPHAAVIMEAYRIFPIIMESLKALSSETRDADILLSILLSFSAILTDDNSGRTVATEHIPSIVNHLLALISYPGSTTIRETSLQCLTTIVTLPYPRVFPYKTQVLRALPASLDDPKRSVRREAIRCRQAWTALGR